MAKQLDDHSMKLYAELLESVMPPGWGFTLITFELNRQPAKLLYISNAQREDMRGTLKSVLDKWNRGEDFTNPIMN